jgi:N-acetylglucosamine kinase-like BadF-type ATPase
MARTKKTYCVAVASGHRETHFLACTRSPDPSKLALKFLNETKGRSLNLHSVSEQERRNRFKDGLLEVIDEKNLDDCYVCLSMPGISTEKHLLDAKKLLTQFDQLREADTSSIVDDTVAGLIAGIGSLEGVCVFSGSGSSVFNGLGLSSLPEIALRPQKIDGYGPLLGDRGSGFKITVELLSKSLIVAEHNEARRALGYSSTDANEVWQLLSRQDPSLEELGNCQAWFDQLIENSTRSQIKRILEWLETKHPAIKKELLEAVDLGERSQHTDPDLIKKNPQDTQEPTPWYVRIAHLNEKVMKAIDLQYNEKKISLHNFGEPGSWTDLACTALSRAAIEMANSTRIAMHASDDQKKIKIVCQGGMMRKSEFYFQEFKRVFSGLRREIFRSPYPPVIGALAVAIKQNNAPPNYVKEFKAIKNLDDLKSLRKEHPENENK